MERNNKIRIGSFVISGLIILLFSVLYIPYQLRHDNLHTENTEILRDISNEFGEFINDRITALNAISINKPVVEQILTGEMENDSPQSRCLLGTSRLIAQASIVYIMDMNGTVVACSVYEDNKTLVGNNYAFRPYFTGAMKGETVIYPAVGVTTYERGIYLGKPVYKDGSEEIIGVAVIKLGLEEFDDLIKDFKGYAALISPDNVIFASNNKDWLFKTIGQTDNEELERINKSKQYGDKKLTKLDVDLNGKEHLFNGENYGVEKTTTIIPGWELLALFEHSELPPLSPVQSYLLLIGLLIELILIIAAIILFVNITKRKEVENVLKDERRALEATVNERTKELSGLNEKLSQSLKQFEIIFDTSPDITVLTELENGKIVRVNEPFINTLGYSSEEVLGTSAVYLWKNPEDRMVFASRLKKKGVCHNFESVFVKKDGSILLGMVSGKVLDLNGIPHIIAITKDITYLKESEKEKERLKIELEHSKKMESIGTLAAGIAHEINSPLQFTNDNLDFIANSYEDIIRLVNTYKNLMMSCKTDEDKSSAKNTIADIERKINLEFLTKEMPDALSQTKDGLARIRKIINAMKQYTHLNNEEKKPSNVNETLENAQIITRNEWKYFAEIENRLDPDLPIINAFEAELNQVFMNLIVNAAHTINDAIDQKIIEKGKIIVKTEQKDENIIISISDNGLGIPEELKERIYDPFFTTKEVGKGTGQGLAIAHSIISDKHKGRIWFETELNKGTTFFIELPIL